MKEYIVKDNIAVFDGLNFPELIRCKGCKYWCEGDMFPPIEGIAYHSCWILIGIGVKDNEALVPDYHYCAWAERKG